MQDEAEDGRPATPRFAALEPRHMPRDFSISLDAHRRGGERPRQTLPGFDPEWRDVIDYVVRITHRIWEEKDIGLIYDTYSHDCRVWDDLGLQYGREKIVADTVHTCNAFPDIRLVADEIVWAGDAGTRFRTSHRTMIQGTNTGFSRFGAPTGRRARLLCVANCVSRDNMIYEEHVAYDTAQMVRALGLDLADCARRMAAEGAREGLPADFMAAEPSRLPGQGAPARRPAPDRIGEDPEAFVRAALHQMWNRRDLSALQRIYAPDVVFEGSTGRVFRGPGQIRAWMLSLLAMFPDLALSVDDLYWMGNPEEGFLIAIRWSALGAHRGVGPYGPPTGREAHLWGITQWVAREDRVVREWTVFNEFGALMQLLG
jgi:hypothetical protein